jgi:hypothetical protein
LEFKRKESALIIPNVSTSLITDEELKAARISRSAFNKRVQLHFCPAMTKYGNCTQVCENCKISLRNALKNIMPRVRDPEAVITWRLRGAVAIVNETKSKQSKQPQVHRDKRGFRLEKNNGFDKLAEKLA